MTDEFVNSALNEAFLLYKDNHDSVIYNGFLVSAVRMLIIIYGEEIVNLFDAKDVQGFNNLLTKYGYSIDEVNDFTSRLLKANKALIRQKDKAIKKKNKYFNVVQKDLIDMLVKKNEHEPMDKNLILQFYNLLFTANNSDFYRKSIAVLEAYNPYEIDEYFKKKNLI